MTSIELRKTEDGSFTVYNFEKKESYHSIHGAVQESLHVFISAGYKKLCHSIDSMNIIEIGFGTGLNALLTLAEFQERGDSSKVRHINYYGVEPNPINTEIIKTLDYCDYLAKPVLLESFYKLHQLPKNQTHLILSDFTFTRFQCGFQELKVNTTFDLVYFDAFSPETEPLLWSRAIFEKLYLMMNKGGIVVTYCSKGIVRRTLIDCGFIVERIPGPPGKHEMLRAFVS